MAFDASEIEFFTNLSKILPLSFFDALRCRSQVTFVNVRRSFMVSLITAASMLCVLDGGLPARIPHCVRVLLSNEATNRFRVHLLRVKPAS